MAVPILMYHEVGPPGALTERYTVSTESFREQMQYLRDHRFRTLSLREYREAVIGGSPLAERNCVIITFDDNNVCHHSITTPILSEFGFRATFFIVSSFIDTAGDMLTSEQLLQIKHAGMSIESHSHTHRFLSELAPAELRTELESSRNLLEERIGQEVRFVSCPGGRYSREVLRTALDLGYWGVCTSVPGLSSETHGRPPTSFCRFLVSADTTMGAFAGMVSGEQGYVRREVLRYRAKAIGKRILGNEMYDRLWRRFRRDL